MKRSGRLRINTSTLLAVVLWSGSAVGGKLALTAFSPLMLISLRCLLGTPLLLLILPASDRRGLLQPGRERRFLVLAGLVSISNTLLFMLGLQFTTATHAILIYATTPIWTALLAMAIGQDRVRRHVLAGVAVAFVGVLILVERGLDAGGATLLGDGLTFVGTLLFAVSILMVARVTRYYGALACTAGFGVVGLIGSLPVAVVAVLTVDWAAVGVAGWVGLGYHVLIAFFIGHFLWNRGISQIGSTQAAVYNYLQPVLGVLLAAMVLGEQPELSQLAGAAVVLTGVALAQGRLSGLRARLGRRTDVPAPSTRLSEESG